MHEQTCFCNLYYMTGLNYIPL